MLAGHIGAGLAIRCSTRTRYWSWTLSASSSAAITLRCWRPMGGMPRCRRGSSPLSEFLRFVALVRVQGA